MELNSSPTALISLRHRTDSSGLPKFIYVGALRIIVGSGIIQRNEKPPLRRTTLLIDTDSSESSNYAGSTKCVSSGTLSRREAGLIQSVSQAPWPGLSAWVEVGGIALFLCPKPHFLPPIST